MGLGVLIIFFAVGGVPEQNKWTGIAILIGFLFCMWGCAAIDHPAGYLPPD